jgi:6-phosphogluconolactonase
MRESTHNRENQLSATPANSRRDGLWKSAFSRRGLLMGAAALASARRMPAEEDDFRAAVSLGPPYAYIGAYTGGSNARGISIYHIEPSTNVMTLVNIVAPVSSPSFIVIDAAKKFLYSGNESGAGSASSFAINQQSGELRLLNSVAAGGQPAHVFIHPGGKYLLTANYTGSTVAVIPIQADGSLSAASQIIPHFGDLGTNAGRQEAPHPHMVLPDAAGKYVLVNDLGLDVTIVYSFDATAGTLTEVNRVSAAPGSGPRHLAWHPNGRVVYSINELSNSLNTYAWDGNGGLTATQEGVSTLPAGFRGNSGAGEVLVDAAGKFLYASNRGSDNIAIFSIDPVNAHLTVVGWVHTQGRTPRHFNFDPSGNFIHVANQDSANIVSFKLDKSTGMLTPSGQYLSTAGAACIQFGYPV